MLKNFAKVLPFTLCQILLINLACLDVNKVSNSADSSPSSVDGTAPTSTPTSTQTNSPIRTVDLANAVYPAYPVYTENQEPFKLVNGTYKKVWSSEPFGSHVLALFKVIYADLTGDGQEEAISILAESGQGTATPFYLYFFALKNGEPKVIWAVPTGDRGDGGLRTLYVRDTDLVIELYGKNTDVENNLANQEEAAGACCPKFFTRSTYRWTGDHFKRLSQEILPNPSGDARLEIQPMDKPN